MAAPSFVNAGTGATDAGGVWSYTCQAAAAAGRIFIVHILQDGGTGGVVAVTGATNIENLAGTDNAWTSITNDLAFGTSSEGHHFILIGRSLSTSAPTISGTNSTSEDLYIRSYQFADVSTGTTLATVIENVTAGSTTTSSNTSNTATDASVQTLGPDRLALNFVAVNDDNAISAFTGETGGDWTLAVAPYADSGGTDGAIGLQTSPIPGPVSPYWEANSPANVQGTGGTSEEYAQKFTAAASETITSVQFAIFGDGATGTPGDNLVVEIQTDAAGVPSGTVVGTGGSIAGATSLGSGRLSVTVSASVTASTSYWIVFRRSGARDTSNYYTPAINSSDIGANRTYVRNSGTWSLSGANDTIPHAIFSGTGATIDGGTGSIVDSDAWGVVGFALIGTTVVLDQQHYRFRNDDGDETTATWLADLDTDVN